MKQITQFFWKVRVRDFKIKENPGDFLTSQLIRDKSLLLE